jgi:voltage-gated potassium channel
MAEKLRPFAKLYTSVALFVAVILSGTIGYMAIEHYTLLEAVYMTIITLSTVGYGEVRPLSNPGRVFTIILILANLGTFAYLVSSLSSYFMDGEFINMYKLYKMKNSIKDLRGHIIICGFGRNGREAAQIFNSRGKDFVIVERANMRFSDVPYPVRFHVEDDATRDETLLEAGIENASALVTSLPDDASNLYVVLTARELNPRIKIISRASNDSAVKKLKTAGADNVIMPDKIGGAHMAALVLSPDVKELVDLMATQNSESFDIAEIECHKSVTLEDLDCWRKTGATILGIKTGVSEYILNPPANTVLQAGNYLIVMGSQMQLNSIRALVG